MEEASVAGESPDRSKQHESSEEPTSGSAGPVPEARTGTSEKRDPRVAVAREAAKPSASAGSAASAKSAGSRGGVDTATRVLSVRDAQTGEPAEDDDAGNDDADVEGSAGGGSSEGSDASRASGRTGSSAASDGPGDSDAADEPAGPAAAGDGRLRDAVAAWVATAEERAASGARREETADGAEDTPGAGAAEAARRDAGVDADTDEDEPGAASGTDTDADAGSGGSRDAAKPAVGGGAPEGGETAPEDGTDGPGADGADGEADGGADAPQRAEDDADERAAAGQGTDDAPRDGKTPADAAAASDADAAGRDRGGEAAGSDDGGAPGASGKEAVDQPTAVFKAVRPSERGVDQPTTMLKLGDAATAPESDAERTSKFVALRHPDDPATRKPPRSAKAPSEQSEPPEAPGAPQAPRTGTTTAVPHVGPERTTQQPLPPKPPLDLLAELTNTPPPPETPLRTTVRRVKIWTPLVLLLVIILGIVQSMRPLPAPELDLTAQDSFTFEGGKPEIPWPSSGQAALDVQGIGSFGSSGEQKPVPIASVAKVMTAYVILRDHPLESGADGPMIEIDQAAEDQSDAGDESTVNVYAGDKISQREALDAILIASANNVARLLARWDAGSEKAFVEKMNAAAEDLGMTNTTYTDPSGLNDTTVSTAVDQVKLAKAAMESVAFREVAQKMSYDDYKGKNHPNWNQLVGHNGVVGIKTGTTTSALGNLVFAAKKEVGGETRTIVGAVVRQPATAEKGILAAALDSSDQLIRAAQDILESATILKKGDVVGYVDDGLGGRTPVVATKDVKAVGWPGLTVKLTFDADEVPHTAAAGTKVGTLTVGDGGTAGAVKVPVALQKDLVEPAFTDRLTRLG
ncbi:MULTISPECIES: D-alanyl-D-alanine carboxypeptidase [unclassified Streptomyces]|uniref:D-alanyl-D-alanine carboxypeptidase n=1 Tax=Streptomyces TaxID=1883 RepID=UPI0025B52A74|nr:MULTISPECIES: D-alanyl-D-alanine carboxypeptidase [unclassified Streptomyces]MDN3250513.1 D-alanyl-D-alanine carboxypeptidase [Streptomyces sp. ZSW22]MDN3254006.1 D-alanyl-D-alanine carboxypeptidase [Streptomyces sp. MA25(2023)]